MKVKYIDIIILMLYMAIFKIEMMPQVVQQTVKILFVIIILIFLFSRMKLKRLFNASLLVVVSIWLSGLLSFSRGEINMRALLDGVLYGICIYVLYTVIQYCYETNYLEKFIFLFYRITQIYCALTLISILLVGTSSRGTEMTYFVGNKFSVSYLFFVYMTFYYMINKKKIEKSFQYKAIYIVVCCVTLFVCWWVKCSTGVMGTIALIVLYMLPILVQRVMRMPLCIIVSMIFSGIIPLGMTVVMANKVVQHVVLNVLHKDLSMTGRLYIYKQLIEIIKNHFWFGYGYNSYVVVKRVGYGNTQNGLMEWMVNFGFIGVIMLLLFIFFLTRKLKNTDRYWGEYMLVYGLIVCSIVEISYNYIFFMALFLLHWGQIGGYIDRRKTEREHMEKIVKNDILSR